MKTSSALFLSTLMLGCLTSGCVTSHAQLRDDSSIQTSDTLVRSPTKAIDVTTALVRSTIDRIQEEPPSVAPAARVPAEAAGLMTELNRQTADEKTSPRTKKLIESLTQLQDRFTKAGRLDDAVTVRDGIRDFKLTIAGVKPAPASLTAFRGEVGRSYYFSVVGRTTGSIWGNDIYTDDSDLGTVAVHAGVLKPGEKGVVKVTIFDGRDSYEASEQHGISSSPYANWQGSYVVEAANLFPKEGKVELNGEAKVWIGELGNPSTADGGLFEKTIENLRRLQQTASSAGKLDEALALRSQVSTLLGERVGARPDPVTLTGLRGAIGQTFFFRVTGRTAGSVWGSGVYTDDSNIGTAAVHAGLLRPGQQGIVRATILPGLPGYEGSARNGVASSPYAEWQGSYRLQLVTTL